MEQEPEQEPEQEQHSNVGRPESISSSVLKEGGNEDILEKENVRLFWGGGVARSEMRDGVEIISNAAGEGVHVYAYVDTNDTMKVNFTLDELSRLTSKEVDAKTKNRIKYVLKHGDAIGKWIQTQVTEKNRSELHKFMVELAKGTDEEFAGEIAAVIPNTV